MKMKIFFSSIILVAIMAACTHPAVPEDAQKESRLPHIYPDYTEVTIPCNICPLNFAVRENASEVVAKFTFPGGEIAYGRMETHAEGCQGEEHAGGSVCQGG